VSASVEATGPDDGVRYVIGVAGPVGGGKTTLVRELAGRFPGAACIYFDDYEQLTGQPIEKIKQWMISGGATDELPVAGLAEDLRSLKAGAAIKPAGRYVFFETQFGRRHAATGVHIDFLVWIDTPLDIALARKVRQMAVESSAAGPDDPGVFSGWLQVYLGNYLDVVGDLLRIQRETVATDADMVIDGTADSASLVRQVEAGIEQRFGAGRRG